MPGKTGTGRTGIDKRPYRKKSCPDYGTYSWSRRELFAEAGKYIAADLLLSNLFFEAVPVFLFFLPGFWIYLRERQKEKARQQQRQLSEEFLTAMQLTATALSAGYALENALRESSREMEKLENSGKMMRAELEYITGQMELSIPAEQLILDLGRRSHVEDIQNFGEILLTAKRTGGDLQRIIRNTVSSMEQKRDTLKEIEAGLSGKKMEQKLMGIIPLFILLYVKISSGGFLNVMYETLAGRIVMCICLLLYGIGTFWGKRVMDIPV